MIEVYNFLDGKNLCNIFASLIVDKINESFPDAKTEITVINVRNFFVIKGRTNSDVVINCSDILQDFLKEFNQEENIKSNVIDAILYNTKVENEIINLSYTLDKKQSERSIYLQNYLNKLLDKKINLSLEVNDELKYVFYDTTDEDDFKILELLSNEFIDYYIVKKDKSNEIFVSDRYYGLSNNTEKMYHTLLRNVTHHLFSLGISKNVDIKLVSYNDIHSIDNLNVDLIIKGNHIVKKEWLESLILDIFPFEYNELKNKFGNSDTKSYEEITTNYKNCTWKKLDLSKEFILF